MDHQEDREMHRLMFFPPQTKIQRIKEIKFLLYHFPLFFSLSFSQEHIIKKLFREIFNGESLIIDKLGHDIICWIEGGVTDGFNGPLGIKRQSAPQPVP